MVNFQTEQANSDFMGKVTRWVKDQDIEDILKGVKRSAEDKKSRLRWLPRRIIEDPQRYQIGAFNGKSSKIYSRPMDPVTFVHEVQHGEFFLKNTQAGNNTPGCLDEALAFALEAMTFGNEDSVRSFLGQDKIYDSDSARFAHLMIQDYYVEGKFFAADVNNTINRAIKKSKGDQTKTLTELSERLISDPQTLSRLDGWNERNQHINGTQKTVQYFVDAFNLPERVARTIVGRNDYGNWREAAVDIGDIKITTINAYKRIVSGLHILGDVRLDKAKEIAADLIEDGLQGMILQGLGRDFEEVISLAYQTGGMELTKHVARKSFTSASHTEYLARNLPDLLKRVSAMPEGTRDTFVRRFVKSKTMQRFVENDGLKVVKGFVSNNDPIIGERYVRGLCEAELPQEQKQDNFYYQFGYGPIEKIRKMPISDEHKNALLGVLPEIAVIATQYVFCKKKDELFKSLFGSFVKPDSWHGTPDPAHVADFIGYGYGKDDSSLMDITYQRAQRAGGNLRSALKTEVERLTRISDRYIKDLNTGTA